MRILLFTLLLAGFSNQAQASSYAAYGLFATGSIRVIGMGGAFAALSDDATGLIFNPAGLAHGKWKYDFGASTSQITNTELVDSSISSFSSVPEQKYTTQFYSAAVRLGKNFVFGVGYNSPFKLSIETDSNLDSEIDTIKEMNLQNLDAALAFRVGKKISLGITGHYETATLKFRDDSLSIPLTEASNSLFYPTLGATYRANKFGLGVAYTPKRQHSIDTSGNSLGSGTTFFKDVQIPAKKTIGAFYRASKSVVLVVDYDMIDAPENAVTPSNGSTEFTLIEEARNVLHGGLEFVFMDDRHTTVKMQAGAYFEDSRIDSISSREHLTLGMEVRFGPVVLGVSYDQAKNFQNTAASFSLSLGDI